MGNISVSERFSCSPPFWVNCKNPFLLVIEEVIGDETPVMTNDDDPVEVVQDEEPRKEEPRVPERIRNPCVKVIVIPWRRIVCDDRWTFLIVIIVYYRWVGLRLVFSILPRTPRQNR
jgi:hypothetical protein